MASISQALDGKRGSFRRLFMTVFFRIGAYTPGILRYGVNMSWVRELGTEVFLKASYEIDLLLQLTRNLKVASESVIAK